MATKKIPMSPTKDSKGRETKKKKSVPWGRPPKSQTKTKAKPKDARPKKEEVTAELKHPTKPGAGKAKSARGASQERARVQSEKPKAAGSGAAQAKLSSSTASAASSSASARPGRDAQRPSAEHNKKKAAARNSEEHTRKMKLPLAPELPTGPTRCGTVALVGRPNVGKSSLLNAILGQKIAATTHKPQTTRRALRGVYTSNDTQIIFVDTPGLHDEKGGLFSFMLDEAKDAAAGVDVLAFLVEMDAKGGGVAPADEAALKTLEGKVSGKPALLVINKIDVLADKSKLLPVLSGWASKADFKALIPVSAHKKDGLRAFVDEIRKHLPEAPFKFPKDSLTDQSERDIAAELIREKVMLELHQEIPYRAAVVVELFDEARREDRRKPLVHISAQIVVEKDSQKAMVIGAGGQRIKAIGQRARQELQHLLGCQVHLELFVRVEEGWTETAQGLRKLGYTRT